MKQILITEKQLDDIMREEICKVTASLGDRNFENFMEGLSLTLVFARAAHNILNRLFHSEEVNV